jgi:hypothetical protein
MGVDSVPDLLRRFVATPYSSTFSIGNAFVVLETNDISLSRAIQREIPQLVARTSEQFERYEYWKLIRDETAPRGGSDISVLSSAPLETLLVGNGTIIAVDRERQEVLGFVAPDITAARFATRVLPLVLRLLHAGSSREASALCSYPIVNISL